MQPLACPLLGRTVHDLCLSALDLLLRLLRTIDSAQYVSALCDISDLAGAVFSVIHQLRASAEESGVIPSAAFKGESTIYAMPRVAAVCGATFATLLGTEEGPEGEARPRGHLPISISSYEQLVCLHHNLMEALSASLLSAPLGAKREKAMPLHTALPRVLVEGAVSACAAAAAAPHVLAPSRPDGGAERFRSARLLGRWISLAHSGIEMDLERSESEGGVINPCAGDLASACCDLLQAVHCSGRLASGKQGAPGIISLDDHVGEVLRLACLPPMASHDAVNPQTLEQSSLHLAAVLPALIPVLGTTLKRSQSDVLRTTLLRIARAALRCEGVNPVPLLAQLSDTGALLSVLPLASLHEEAAGILTDLARGHPLVFSAAACSYVLDFTTDAVDDAGAVGSSSTVPPHAQAHLAGGDDAWFCSHCTLLNDGGARCSACARGRKSGSAPAPLTVPSASTSAMSQASVAPASPSAPIPVVTFSGADAAVMLLMRALLRRLTSASAQGAFPPESSAHAQPHPALLRVRARGSGAASAAESSPISMSIVVHPPTVPAGPGSALRRPSNAASGSSAVSGGTGMAIEDGTEDSESDGRDLDSEVSGDALLWHLSALRVTTQLLLPVPGSPVPPPRLDALAFQAPEALRSLETVVAAGLSHLVNTLTHRVTSGFDNAVSRVEGLAMPSAGGSGAAPSSGTAAVAAPISEEEAERRQEADDACLALACATEAAVAIASRVEPTRLHELRAAASIFYDRLAGRVPQFMLACNATLFRRGNSERIAELGLALLPAALAQQRGQDRRIGLHPLPRPVASTAKLDTVADALLVAALGHESCPPGGEPSLASSIVVSLLAHAPPPRIARLAVTLLDATCDTLLSEAAVLLDASLSPSPAPASAGSGHVFGRVVNAARERTAYVVAALLTAVGDRATSGLLELLPCVVTDAVNTLGAGMLLLLSYERQLLVPQGKPASAAPPSGASVGPVGGKLGGGGGPANNSATQSARGGGASGAAAGSANIAGMFSRISDSQQVAHGQLSFHSHGAPAPAARPTFNGAPGAPVLSMAGLRALTTDARGSLRLPGALVDALTCLLQPAHASPSAQHGLNGSVLHSSTDPALVDALQLLASLKSGSGATLSAFGATDQVLCAVCHACQPVMADLLQQSQPRTAGSASSTTATQALLRYMDVEPMLNWRSSPKASSSSLPAFMREPALSAPLIPSIASETILAIARAVSSAAGKLSAPRAAAALLRHAAADQVRLPYGAPGSLDGGLEASLLQSVLTGALSAGTHANGDDDGIAALCTYVSACSDLLPCISGGAGSVGDKPPVGDRDARLSTVLRRVLQAHWLILCPAGTAVPQRLIALDLAPDAALPALDQLAASGTSAAASSSASSSASLPLDAWLDAEGARTSLPSTPATQRDACLRLVTSHFHRILRRAGTGSDAMAVERTVAALLATCASADALSSAAGGSAAVLLSKAGALCLQPLAAGRAAPLPEDPHGSTGNGGPSQASRALVSAPSYLLAESLLFSPHQHTARGFLALLDTWVAAHVAAAASAPSVSEAPGVPAATTAAAAGIRRLAQSYGHSPLGLLRALRDEVLPRAAIALLHPHPASMLPVAPGSAAQPQSAPSADAAPLILPFVDEVLGGECSAAALLLEAREAIIPTLLLHGGECEAQLAWLAWFLRAETAGVATSVRTDPAPTESAADTSTSGPSAGSKRKPEPATSAAAATPTGKGKAKGGAASEQPKAKRQRTLSEFGNGNSGDITIDDDNLPEAATGGGSFSQQAALHLPFEALPPPTARLLLARLLTPHGAYLLVRLLLHGTCDVSAFSCSLSLLLAHVADGGSSYREYVSGVFESAVKYLTWYLGEEPCDSPHNRAAAALRGIAFVLLGHEKRLPLTLTVQRQTLLGHLHRLLPYACNPAVVPQPPGVTAVVKRAAFGAKSPERGAKAPAGGAKGAKGASNSSSGKGGGAVDSEVALAEENSGVVHDLAVHARVTTFTAQLAAAGGGRKLTELQAGEVIASVSYLHLPLSLLLQRHLLMLLHTLSGVVAREAPHHKARSLASLQRLIVRVHGDAKLDKFFPSISALLKLAQQSPSPALALQTAAIWDVLVRLLHKSTLLSYFSAIVVGLAASAGGVEGSSGDGFGAGSGIVSRPGGGGTGAGSDRPFSEKETAAQRAFDRAVAVDLRGFAASASPTAGGAGSKAAAGPTAPLAPVPPALLREDAPGYTSPDWEIVCDAFGGPLRKHAAAAASAASSGAAGKRGVIDAHYARAPEPLRPRRPPFGGCDSLQSLAHRTLHFLLEEKQVDTNAVLLDVPGVSLLPALTPFAGAFRAALDIEEAQMAVPPSSLSSSASPLNPADQAAAKEQQRVGLRLAKLASLLRHDSDSVQELALREAMALLTSAVRHTHALVLRAASSTDASGGASSAVTGLLLELLDLNRRSTSAHVRQLVAACLGQLGAIDPARVAVLSRREHQPELGDHLLAVHLMRGFLVKTLRAASDSSVQDRIAYALQELLSFYRQYHSIGGADDMPAPPPHASSPATRKGGKALPQAPAPAAGGGKGATSASARAAAAAAAAASNDVMDLTEPEDDPSQGGGTSGAPSDDYLEYRLSSAASSGAVTLPKEFESVLRADVAELQKQIAREGGGGGGGDQPPPASAGSNGKSDEDEGEGGDGVRELVEVLQPYWSSSLQLKSHAVEPSSPYMPIYLVELRDALAERRAAEAGGGAAVTPVPAGSPLAGGGQSRAPRGRTGTHFERWVGDWCRYLMDCLCREAPDRRRLWDPCRLLVHQDIPAALYLLPYLLRDALVRCSGDVQASIVSEVRAVLLSTDGSIPPPAPGPTVPSSSSGVDDDEPGAVGDDDEEEAAREEQGDADAVDEGDAASSAGVVAGFKHRATQAVFTLLDTLQRWHVSPKGPAAAPGALAGGVSLPDDVVLSYQQPHMARFFAQVPPRVLATSARRVHAYARALQQFELHLRTQRGGPHGSARVPSRESRRIEDNAIGGVISGPVPFSRRELFTLQSIYSSIDADPDGMAAVGVLRSRLLMSDGALPSLAPAGARGGAGASSSASSSSLSLSPGAGGGGANDSCSLAPSGSGPGSSSRSMGLLERILDCEHDNRWGDALMCYEQALQYQPGSSGGGTGSAPLAGGAAQTGGAAPQQPPSSAIAGPVMMSEASLHRGVLNCLKHVGHLDSAMHRAMGVLTRRPDLSHSVAPFAVEASWRLGQWAPLTRLVSADGGAHSTDADGSDDPDSSAAASASDPIQSLALTVPSPASTHHRDYETSLGSALLHLHHAVDGARAQARARRNLGGMGVAAAVALAAAQPLSASASSSSHPQSSTLESLRALFEPRGAGVLQSAGDGAWGDTGGVASAGAGITAPTAYRLLHGIARGLAPESLPATGKPSGGNSALLSSHADTLAVLSSIASRLLHPSIADLPSRLPQAGGSYGDGGSAAPSAAAAGESPSASGPGAHVSQCRDAITAARRETVVSLAAASMESYTRAYPFLLRLHCLREIEACVDAATSASASGVRGPSIAISELGWEDRLRLTAPSLPQREALLALRRALYGVFGMRDAEAGGWLDLARIARATGNASTANAALMHASSLGSDVAGIHAAKLLHSQGLVHRALLHLEPAERDLKSVVKRLRGAIEDAKAHNGDDKAAEAAAALEAKRTLLATNWMAESRLIGEAAAVSRYRTVIELHPSWEKGHFYLGRYYDSLLKAMRAEPPPDPQRSLAGSGDWVRRRDEVLRSSVEHYARSLLHGHSRVFQSLPRLLTLFFDYGAACAAAGAADAYRETATRTGMYLPQEETLKKITDILKDTRTHMMAYRWMPVLAQLVSRVCHRHPLVHGYISQTLGAILITFAQQAVWTLMGLVKSRVQLRKERGDGILRQARSSERGREHRKLFATIEGLFDELIRVAQDPSNGQPGPPGAPPQPAAANDKSYRLVVANDAALGSTNVLLPLQSSLTVVLHKQPGDPANGFQASAPTIVKFERSAEVMASKERPKKVTIVASDGRRYHFLCKQERRGDLRKDARMMECAGLINRLMAKDTEARRRRLGLRTYAVQCLNEECGLLQWVPRTAGFRGEVGKGYSAVGLKNPTSAIKDLRPAFEKLQSDPLDDGARAVRYRADILPSFPAVFHKWFLMSFPDPADWLASRLTFARSSAVWSMVGHVIGLGDRHGENLLLDGGTGEVVHVDFDCLFDKGMTLTRPEIVPFRLTPSMLDGLGVGGYEGTFRRVSETAMGVLRGNREMLVSVLESFIHDPLVEWARKSSSSSGSAAGAAQPPGGRDDLPSTAVGAESENQDGVKIVQRINQRLDGVYNAGVEFLPPRNGANSSRYRDAVNRGGAHRLSLNAAGAGLAIPGQVDRLLKEATDDRNLALMYIGWLPVSALLQSLLRRPGFQL